MAEQDKCRVTRTGVIRHLNDDSVVIEVEGKRLTVPAVKLFPGLQAGDEVSWTGGKWRLSDRVAEQSDNK